MMTRTRRRIGPIGTSTRLLVGAGLVYVALFNGTSWRLTWYGAALGLAVLPGAMLALGLTARLHGKPSLRFTGSAGVTLNCLVIVALLANPYTSSAAELFYGVTLLAAAWRAQPGCEATVLSNWILGRDDEIGCPTFTPIDRAEARRIARRTNRPTAAPLVLNRR